MVGVGGGEGERRWGCTETLVGERGRMRVGVGGGGREEVGRGWVDGLRGKKKRNCIPATHVSFLFMSH